MKYLSRVVSILLIGLLFFGCSQPKEEKPLLRVLVNHIGEVLPLAILSGDMNRHFNWEIIVDTQGDLTERLERHNPDFFIIDFMALYELHSDNVGFLAKRRAMLNLPTSVALVARVGLSESSMDSWRFGFNRGKLNEFLLDYWFPTQELTRIHLRDEEIGANLLREQDLDAMILSYGLATELINEGNFFIVRNALSDAARLSFLIGHQADPDEELYMNVMSDYLLGMRYLTESDALFSSLDMSLDDWNLFRQESELAPFFAPERFEQLRNWRLIHLPFSRSWLYDELIWTPLSP